VTIQAPDTTRQIGFHQLLVAARKLCLMDALAETLATVDARKVKAATAYVTDGGGSVKGRGGNDSLSEKHPPRRLSSPCARRRKPDDC
jgi:hypothetical protein